MRILTVGNMYPPHHLGGYELVWAAAVAHLRAGGHTVRVLATDHRGPTRAPEAPDVHRELHWYWCDHAFPRRSAAACLALARHNGATLARHLAELAPDVLAWFSLGGLSLSLLERGRRAGIPAVAFVHDDWLDYGRRVDGWHRRFGRRRRSAALAERLTGVPTRIDFSRAARYAFVSRATRDRARASGLSLADVTVAPSGVEPRFLAPAAERPWRWRLLYVGRIDPRKGVHTAVETLVRLPAESTLTVVGDGDAREVSRLRERAARLGVTARVRLEGAQPRDELPDRYAEADALVFPVVWEEPWGLVPLEAMGIGVPVIATARGGSSEYLRPEGNCLTFPAEDPAALARSVRRLAQDAALRGRLRAGGLETAPRHTEAAFHETVGAELVRAARPPGRAADSLRPRAPGRARRAP